MKFIQGNDITQTHLFPVSMDQSIDPDNEVRLIDLFADSLPLADYGFKMEFVENGRPAYHPGDLLKLFILARSPISAKIIRKLSRRFSGQRCR